ncbi:MAG: hypothetical protein MJE66_10975 [Proteobacteria bacterium]|nr:hypothetical protein [Pseudomonadota bacterium]
MSGDDDRPRRSWAEIDRLRDKPRERGERRPQGRAAEARAQAASDAYLKEMDAKLFRQGGGEGEELAKAVRDAHGSPGLDAACRAYFDALGAPADVSLLSIFLDAGDSALVVAALEALAEQARGGKLTLSAGLRRQVRAHAEGFDDASAEAAEDLLALV